MPRAMKVKCFILFFAVFIVIGKTDQELEYLDCGSYLQIDKLEISDCTEAPCVFSPGQNFTAEILLSGVIELDRTEVTTEAYLWMYGAKWPLDINPVDPCSNQWRCPVVEVNNLTYVAQVHILDSVMKRPAHVELLITYDKNGTPFQALCVQFSVTLQ